MSQLAEATHDILRLVEALAQRNQAWQHEALTLDVLGQTLRDANFKIGLEALNAVISEAETARQALDAKVEALGHDLEATIALISTVTETLQAVTHDPHAGLWRVGLDKIENLAEQTTAALAEQVEPLRAAIADTANEAVGQTADGLTQAVDALSASGPDHLEMLSGAAAALAEAVEHGFAVVIAEVTDGEATMGSYAEQVSQAVVGQQLDHADGLAGDFAGLYEQFQEGIRAICALGDDLETLRDQLDEALADFNSPISDIRSTLTQINDRIESI
ncbi:hypothetical protein [Xanthobacter versatilis]|uniref:hypothetical protein n=1 Tax=Xanthobacter autotrophicus (strain ATCC BAA-1158 / Py2) TaxID=78245 RepID=UPI00372CA8EF